jgi:hypothetical protein
VVSKGRPTFASTISNVSPPARPSRASVTDCVSEAAWLKYRRDGTLLNSVPGGRHRVAGVVTTDGTVWKVTEITIGGVGTC